MELRMLRLCGDRFSHGGKAAFKARMDFRISVQEPFEAHTPGGRDLIINAQPPPPDSPLILRNVPPLHHPVERGVHRSFRNSQLAAAPLFYGSGDLIAVAVAPAKAGEDEGFHKRL